MKHPSPTIYQPLGELAAALTDAALLCAAHTWAGRVCPVAQVSPCGLRDLGIVLLAYAGVLLAWPPHISRPGLPRSGVAGRAATTLLLHFMATAGLFALAGWWMGPTGRLIAFWLPALALVTAGRLLWHTAFAHLRRSGWGLRQAVAVGGDPTAGRIGAWLTNPDSGFVLRGVFSQEETEGATRLGAVADAAAYVAATPDLEAVLCQPWTLSEEENEALLSACSRCGVAYYALPAHAPLLQEMEVGMQWGGAPLLTPAPLPLRQPMVRLARRTTDTLAALLFLATLFPLIYLVLAVLIKREDRGPMLVRRTFWGRGGTPFAGLYFRTTRGADSRQSLRIGGWLIRTGWEQLPMLLRVLTGHLSLGGPRYHAVADYEEYTRATAHSGLSQWLSPGLLGCGMAPADSTQAQQDMAYAARWSPWLDARLALGMLWRIPAHTRPQSQETTPAAEAVTSTSEADNHNQS